VFLLNDALTVKEGKPKSHKDIPWEFFTNGVIKLISQKLDGVVFMLWGKPAQKKKSLINTSKVILLI
jgi:uracil-DNA glycosylase